MKILILIGMVIVFISAFFIFFVFDTSINAQIACFMDPEAVCGSEEMGAFVIGLLMIGMFIIIDIVTIYVVITTAMSETGTL